MYVRSLLAFCGNCFNKQWRLFFGKCREKICSSYEYSDWRTFPFYQFCQSGTGLLFCFTYLFVAMMNIFDLNPLPFAWFSSFVAVNAVVFGIVEGVTGSEALGIVPDWRWAAIWWLWAVLWGTSFVTDIMGKKLGKFVPCLQVFEGIVTAWIPGVLLLLGVW